MYAKTDLVNYHAIGRRIKQKRTMASITQETLAEMVGVSSVHISNIENAHTKVSLPTLVAISNALQVSLDELVSDSLFSVKHLGIRNQDDFFNALSAENKQVILDLVVALRDILVKYNH